LDRTGLRQCTDDHSVAAELERVGSLSAEEVSNHPQRHVLTRAIGPFRDVRVDRQVLSWAHGDRLVLCTDGLYNTLSDARIFDICQRFEGQAAVDALIAEALFAGGPDDITVVIVESSTGLV
jgi:protein phosphatase